MNEKELTIQVEDLISRARNAVRPDPHFAARLRQTVLLTEPKRSFIFNFFAMRHKGIITAGLALGAVVFVVLASVMPGRPLGAELAYAEGAVLYRTSGGIWQEAESGVNLREGDGVKVKGIGRAIILLDDGSAVRLNNDSEVTLAKLDPKHMQVINEYGQVYSRVVKSKTRAFDVNVEDTFYRALGTAFMTVNTDETKGVEVYHSAVQVIDDGTVKDETKAVVPEGSAYYDVNVNAPKKEDEVTAIATDQVAGNEFVVWNKEQDKQNDTFEKQLGVLAVVATDTSDTSDATANEAASQGEVASALSADILLTPVGANAFTWTKPEGAGQNGFKVVYSKNPAPSYPADSDDSAIYVDVGTTIPWLYAFQGSGTYYVRVCDYQSDGTCGEFSNEAVINLTADSEPVSVVVASTEEDEEDEDESESTVKEEIKAVKEEAKEEVKEIKEAAKAEVKAVKEEAKEAVKEIKTEESVTPVEKYPGAPGESSVSGITLTANAPEAQHVSWTVDGNLVGGMERGVRVIFSKSPSPTYGVNLAMPVGLKNYAKIYPKEGTGTYYVRVCEFLGDRCGIYSNEVTVEVKGYGDNSEYFDKVSGEWKSNRTGTSASSVSGITLTANDPAPEHVSWSVSGSWTKGMDRGFRVLFSKSPNPTFGSALAMPVGYKRFTKIWPKEGAGTYYVRVCEYLGNNTCGTYSNEITVEVSPPGSSGGEYKGEKIGNYR